MANNKPYGYIFIIALVLIVVLAGPTLFKAGTQAYSDFWKNLWEPFKDLGDSTGDNYAILVMTIQYADGTEKEFKPDTFSLLPLSIVDDGGVVSGISFESQATLQMSGTVSSWTARTDFRTPIDDDASNNVVSSVLSSVKYPQGTTWTSGEIKNLDSYSLTADEIEHELAVRQVSAGIYHLKASLTMSITATFTDGATDEITGITNIDWAFTYETGQLESLSLTVTYSSQH